MPIVEHDPWREQYFTGVACPADVVIPTDDGDAYRLFRRHRWVYNKLLVCESQDMECGPHGITPPVFPVFSKPIYNLRGMGAGTRVLHDMQEYERAQAPGDMWMPLCTGEHVSSDTAVQAGEAVWWRHTVGKPLEGGMFDFWTVQAEARAELERNCADWIRKNLPDYTGMMNLETIGGDIIEAHLRFADQWPDLYGRDWVRSVVDLYQGRPWAFDDGERRTGYSVVLFGAHGLQYRAPDPAALQEMLTEPGVSSIQVTFHPDKPPETHSMPPGGFRLAIVNCWKLEAGMRVRERLAVQFWSTQPLRSRRRAKA